MASPGAVSNVTAALSPPEMSSEGSGAEPQRAVNMEERKRKRKESNRLSAQRSRARKQWQLDELTAQVAALRAQNGVMATAARAAAQRCAAVQAENEVLRARALEFAAHLQSLTDHLQRLEAIAAAVAFTATASNSIPFGGAGAVPPPPLLDTAMYCNYY